MTRTAPGPTPSSWAARPEAAQPLVDEVVLAIRATGLAVETGKFRTQMQVELVNDGPVTLIVRV